MGRVGLVLGDAEKKKTAEKRSFECVFNNNSIYAYKILKLIQLEKNAVAYILSLNKLFRIENNSKLHF